jgi:trk system potassium uptake protein TrkA
MFALIAGTGGVGTYEASSLLAEGHQVSLIDRDRAVLAALPPSLASLTVEGDASEPSVLEHAGARRPDLVLASTGADEDNPVVCFWPNTSTAFRARSHESTIRATPDV